MESHETCFRPPKWGSFFTTITHHDVPRSQIIEGGSFSFQTLHRTARNNTSGNLGLESVDEAMVVAKIPDVSDVLIIGGGIAGLYAASTLYRQRHTCIILDSNQPRNTWRTPVHIVPSLENRDPNKLREAAREDLEETGLIRFVEAEIKNITKREDGLFQAANMDGKIWVGRKVLVSTGVRHIFPEIPGYEECYASRMSVCDSSVYSRMF